MAAAAGRLDRHYMSWLEPDRRLGPQLNWVFSVGINHVMGGSAGAPPGQAPRGEARAIRDDRKGCSVAFEPVVAPDAEPAAVASGAARGLNERQPRDANRVVQLRFLHG